MKTLTVLMAALALSSTACSGDDDAGPKSARVKLTPTEGYAVTGTATFTPEGGNLKFVASISNAPAGVHGLHIHEKGACGPDGMLAGGHWNPTTSDHGAWTAPAHHLGDLGNITIDPYGKGTLELTTNVWSIGTWAANDLVDHALVLHASPDDFTTQPTGAAGGRIACGVIYPIAE